MKTILPTALICLTLGFATAWFMRSGHSPASSVDVAKAEGDAEQQNRLGQQSATKQAANQNPLPNTSRNRDSAPQKTTKDDAISLQDVSDKMAEQSQKMMQQMLKNGDDLLLKKLAQRLNLTPEQLKKFEGELAKRREFLSGEDMKQMSFSNDINRQFSQSTLDEIFMKDLSGEQRDSLMIMRQEERKAKVDSSTLKNLGRITQSVTLTDGQRSAIYETLAAEESRKLETDAGNVHTYLMESMGMNTDDMGMQSAMLEPQITEKIANIDHKDPKALVAIMREAMTQKVQSQVNLIAPHLDPNQVEQYRNSLTEQMNATLGMMETAHEMQDVGE